MTGPWKGLYPARPGYWFAPKLFGWGATPVTWQGWTLTIAYVALLVALHYGLDGAWRWLFAIPISIAFFLVARAKTDGGWHWRWGTRD